MTDTLSFSHQLLSRLEGTWTGEGRGEYPGVTSFNYRETLAFTQRDERALAYEQKTQKRYDGQTEYLHSHGETGVIQILDTNKLELVNSQSGGRSERLVGTVEVFGSLIRIHFVSKALSNDPRLIATTRTFELEGNALHYEMGMHTTKVEQLTPHLKIVLQRVE